MMNAEMYARVGGKALPEDNVNTVKVINFVDEEGQPVGKAAHVDPTTGTVTQVVNALIAAGLMASA
jgi:hypothetical protein